MAEKTERMFLKAKEKFGGVIYRDNETGVLYLFFGGGITPLVDRDGKPLVDWEYVRSMGWHDDRMPPAL